MNTNDTFLAAWINVLLKSYAHHPNKAVAKAIVYYLNRLICCRPEELDSGHLCQYRQMVKHWQWLANNKKYHGLSDNC